MLAGRFPSTYTSAPVSNLQDSQAALSFNAIVITNQLALNLAANSFG